MKIKDIEIKINHIFRDNQALLLEQEVGEVIDYLLCEIKKLQKKNDKIEGLDSKYKVFIDELFNPLTNGKARYGSEKAKRQFEKLLLNGYTSKEIRKAIIAAYQCPTLEKKYLTPEYITRFDKFEMWLNSYSNNSREQTAIDRFKENQV